VAKKSLLLSLKKETAESLEAVNFGCEVYIPVPREFADTSSNIRACHSARDTKLSSVLRVPTGHDTFFDL
jgi:hypothetical protein